MAVVWDRKRGREGIGRRQRTIGGLDNLVQDRACCVSHDAAFCDLVGFLVAESRSPLRESPPLCRAGWRSSVRVVPGPGPLVSPLSPVGGPSRVLAAQLPSFFPVVCPLFDAALKSGSQGGFP
jgi:hypothetical protein